MSDIYAMVDGITHRGYEWSIHYSPRTDKFDPLCSGCIHAGRGYDTRLDAIAAAKKATDGFLADIPKTPDEWIAKLEACLVQTGYEDCELDKKSTLHVLELYRQHVKGA